jgi:hypothetical protein
MQKDAATNTKPLNCDINAQLVDKLNKRKRDIGLPLRRQIEDALYLYFRKLETGK